MDQPPSSISFTGLKVRQDHNENIDLTRLIVDLDALQQSLVIPRELPADADEPDSNTKSAAKDGNACSTKVNPPSSPVRTFDELSEEEKERCKSPRAYSLLFQYHIQGSSFF